VRAAPLKKIGDGSFCTGKQNTKLLLIKVVPAVERSTRWVQYQKLEYLNHEVENAAASGR
jgi:hypothetical protein